MQTVYASFFTGNDASRRVMEKSGMTFNHFSEKELTYLDVERDLTYYAIHRKYITLRDEPELKDAAAAWFHSKWGVPEQAYLDCMTAYLNRETEYGWYLCLDGDRIIGGMGVIENDFHDRKDLTPNVCAVYTEEAYRSQGIAGRLLNMVVEDMRSKGISPLYLVTDHTGFYERYGWEFFCMVQGDGEPGMTRMYVHR
jgi:GNAT superfamily N-acetyltransferase